MDMLVYKNAQIAFVGKWHTYTETFRLSLRHVRSFVAETMFPIRPFDSSEGVDPDGSVAKPPTISPSKLAHVVLRTNNIDGLRDFYLQFLGATIAFEVPNVLAFLRYDEEHHRLGIIGMPDIGDKMKKANGLEVGI